MIDDNNTPDGWEIKEIRDVVKESSLGGTPSRSDDSYWGGDIPWMSSGAVRGKYTTESPEESITEKGLEESSTQIWPEGTVLVAMHGRGTIGRSAITSTDIAGNQSICGLITDENIIINEFLYYWLQNIEEFLAYKGRGATASRQNLNQRIILDTKVPVPPIDEQKRIVQLVRNNLEQIDKLGRNIKRISGLSQEYEESLIAFLISNKDKASESGLKQLPTKEDIPDHWNLKSIGQIASEIRTGGTPKRSENQYWGGDIPWKASKHFDENSPWLDPTDQYVTEQGKSESTFAYEDDILLVCRGAHTGKVAIADKKMLFNQDVKVIRLPDEILPKFVYYHLRNLHSYFKQMQRGGTTKGIVTDHVKSIEIPVPPLDEQKRIIEQIESVDVRDIEKSVETVNNLFSEYRSSVLSYAFRGEMDTSKIEGNASNKKIPSSSQNAKDQLTFSELNL